ncbi:MAG: hypothetical protein NC217_06570 [Muribaculaceae bacterium]|nr:hypothetical protein [Muribaculaceae bacterium]
MMIKITNLVFFEVFSVHFFHLNSRIARYAPFSDRKKSLENTPKKFTKLFFNHHLRDGLMLLSAKLTKNFELPPIFKNYFVTLRGQRLLSNQIA